MATTIKYDNENLSLKIEYAKEALMLKDEILQRFMLQLNDLYLAAGLVSFEVKQLGDPLTDFSYDFVADTGATWHQVLRFVDPIETSGNYDLFPLEKVIERHQLVRATVVKIIQDYEITKITATWA